MLGFTALAGLVADAPLLEPAGAHGLDDGVGAAHQLEEDLAALLGAQVEGDRPLAAADVEVHQRRALDDRPGHLADVVAGGRLDLDDVGAEVGERRGDRARSEHRALDDADAAERRRGGGGAGGERSSEQVRPSADDDGTLSDDPSETRSERAAPAWTSPSPPTRTPFARPASASTTRSRTASGCGSSSRSGSTSACGTPSRGWACRSWPSPRRQGGAGASLTDLAAAVEVHGAHCGLVPLVEAAVAARLLAAAGPAGASALSAVAEGAVATFAPRPAQAGVARLVPYAARAQVVVALDGDRLVVAVDAGTTERRTLAGMAAADVDLARRVRARRGRRRPRGLRAGPGRVAVAHRRRPGGPRPGHPRRRACSTPRTATSSACRSAASSRSSTASPTSTTRVDGARLLAYQAIWALDEADPSAPGRAAQASWYCGQVAEEAAGFSLHVHGGYGFMLEYDVQLHVRRAKAARLAARRRPPRAPHDRRAALGRRRPRPRGPRGGRHRPAHASRHGLPRGPGDRGLPGRGAGLHRRPPHPRGGRAGADQRHHARLGLPPGAVRAGLPRRRVAEGGGRPRAQRDRPGRAQPGAVRLGRADRRPQHRVDGRRHAAAAGHRRAPPRGPAADPRRGGPPAASATASPTPGPTSPRSPRGPSATATTG